MSNKTLLIVCKMHPYLTEFLVVDNIKVEKRHNKNEQSKQHTVWVSNKGRSYLVWWHWEWTFFDFQWNTLCLLVSNWIAVPPLQSGWLTLSITDWSLNNILVSSTCFWTVWGNQYTWRELVKAGGAHATLSFHSMFCSMFSKLKTNKCWVWLCKIQKSPMHYGSIVLIWWTHFIQIIHSACYEALINTEIDSQQLTLDCVGSVSFSPVPFKHRVLSSDTGGDGDAPSLPPRCPVLLPRLP